MTRLLFKTSVIAGLTLVVAGTSCNRAEPSEQKTTVSGREETLSGNGLLSSTAADAPSQNGGTGHASRQFLRTASLKFRAENVYESSMHIEQAVKRSGGFVALSNLGTGNRQVETVKVSEDSTLETTTYTVLNNLSVRVPSEKLDTVLDMIAAEVDFLDYRIIKADDVSLALKANELKQKRNEKRAQHQGSVTIDYFSSNQMFTDAQEQADEARLDNLSLYDRISYSTIEMEIYQRESYNRVLLPNKENIKVYEPGFFSRIGAAVVAGWNMLLNLLVALMHVWWLILIAAAGYWLLRRRMVPGRN